MSMLTAWYTLEQYCEKAKWNVDISADSGSSKNVAFCQPAYKQYNYDDEQLVICLPLCLLLLLYIIINCINTACIIILLR